MVWQYFSANHVHTILGHALLPVPDPEEVSWVPWNPFFEGVPLKIPCTNVTMYTTLTLELHTLASTVTITHMCHLLYQEFDVRMAYVHVYTTTSMWQS